MAAPGVDTEEFRRALSRVRELPNEQKAALRKTLRELNKDAYDAVKKEALGSPAKRPDRKKRKRGGVAHKPLRRTLASAVTLETKLKASGITVGVRVKASKMPPGFEKAAKYWDSPKGWKHPVFADKGSKPAFDPSWVEQKGHPFFRKTVEARRYVTQLRVAKAFEDATSSLT